jgi:elongator complex protein 3
MTREPFFDDVMVILKKNITKDQLIKEKVKLTEKYGLKKVPTDIEILLNATAEERTWLKLKAKPMRSIAGVTPVAIMSAPFPCPHGKCTMCPDHLKEGIPMSYTGKEPASMRGLRANWDAFVQVFNRLEQYVVTGHTPEKCDVIVMGGTFPSYPIAYQVGFMRDMYLAMNVFSEKFYPDKTLDIEYFKEFFDLPRNVRDAERGNIVQQRIIELKAQYSHVTLEEAQLTNESGMIRCIGLTFETRPDCGLLPHANLMLRLGGTRVELGVQSVYDECLDAVHRAHDSALTKKSIQVLRDLGFKLNFHMMPGMPGADKERIPYEKDLEGLKQLFTDPAYRPDMLKLYPLMVMPHTPLLEDYNKGLFHPLGTEEAAKMLQEFLPFVEPYCRIMRVQRDIPTYRTVAGVGETNLRQRLHEEESRDIRSREIGNRQFDTLHPELIVQEFEASGGTEFFISSEDVEKNVLIGFVRMRFPSECLRPEITPMTAIVRELHVYGEAAGVKMAGTVQHRGVGSALLKKAEEIARQRGKRKMVVISGIGVREYYSRIHHYSKEGPYVSKLL